MLVYLFSNLDGSDPTSIKSSYVCLLFLGALSPPALGWCHGVGGMLTELFPNTSSYKLLACSLSKSATFLHVCAGTVPAHMTGSGAQLQGPVLSQDSSPSPECGQELETSTFPSTPPPPHPKIVVFKKLGRTCVYWQFINKHQAPCKLFTKGYGEVKKCEYK